MKAAGFADSPCDTVRSIQLAHAGWGGASGLGVWVQAQEAFGGGDGDDRAVVACPDGREVALRERIIQLLPGLSVVEGSDEAVLLESCNQCGAVAGDGLKGQFANIGAIPGLATVV